MNHPRSYIYFLGLLAGCASADNLRVVHPITWHAVDRADLVIECRDADPELRGCVVSRSDGDHIYTLPVCRP